MAGLFFSRKSKNGVGTPAEPEPIGVDAQTLYEPLPPPPMMNEPPDAIEGKWLGMAGPAEDRVQMGFEFKRDAKQELHAYLYEPVNNFYGLDVGAMKAAGGHYVLPE